VIKTSHAQADRIMKALEHACVLNSYESEVEVIETRETKRLEDGGTYNMRLFITYRTSFRFQLIANLYYNILT